MKKFILLTLTILSSHITKAQSQDPYLWLEDIDSKKSLDFVNQQNKATFEKLSHEKEYQNIYAKSLEIYNSSDRIVFPTIQGEFIYNFWQDKDHVRGIWRRMNKISYLSENPNWEILLDLDDMSKKDSVSWVYKGASGLYPSYNRFLISLSKGGGDAVVTKEFDVNTKSFIKNGFYMDEAKGGARLS